MPRTLSNAALTSMMAEETSEPWILLLTMDHADLDDPVRVVRNKTDITSNGNLYVGFSFDVNLPTDSGDTVPITSIRMDNVDRRIVDAVRAISSPATVKLEVILASDPDVVEITLDNMKMRQVEYDALLVEAVLQYEDVLHQAFPTHTYTPANAPGLF